jgi:hypothetical protein
MFTSWKLVPNESCIFVCYAMFRFANELIDLLVEFTGFWAVCFLFLLPAMQKKQKITTAEAPGLS